MPEKTTAKRKGASSNRIIDKLDKNQPSDLFEKDTITSGSPFGIKSPSTFNGGNQSRFKARSSITSDFNYIMRNKLNLQSKYHNEMINDEPMKYKDIVNAERRNTRMSNQSNAFSFQQHSKFQGSPEINEENSSQHSSDKKEKPVKKRKASARKLRSGKDQKMSDNRLTDFQPLQSPVMDISRSPQPQHKLHKKEFREIQTMHTKSLLNSIMDPKYNKDLALNNDNSSSKPPLITIKRHKKRRGNKSNQPPASFGRNFELSSQQTMYEVPRKFTPAQVSQPSSQRSKRQSFTIDDQDYNKIEAILESKNIAYGYGDSKNREKILQFIRDVKNKSQNDKEKTVTTVKERIAHIDNLINGLENDYAHFSYEVGVCEDTFKKGQNRALSEDKRKSTDDLRNFIENASVLDSYIQSPDELTYYFNELWADHYEYEEELANERREHNFDIRIIENELQGKIDWIQQKTSHYIRSIEIALNDTKILKNREIERLTHIINDYESQRMREIIKDEEILRLLKQDHVNTVCIITDAHDIMTTLKNSVRTVNYENLSLKNQLRAAKNIIVELIESRSAIIEGYIAAMHQKISSQTHIVKIIENLNIEDKMVLKEINKLLAKQKKNLVQKMEPSFKNVKEEFKNLNTDDIPIVTQEEIRLRNFIEEINIDESYIKNYLSESNMNDYMNLLPGAFS